MTLLEAAIIYLSAGAPFGVLVFFSQRSARASLAISYSLLATLAWPGFGTYRLYRGLIGKKRREALSPAEDTRLAVLDRLYQQNPIETAELFEIAGHSNPWVATNCYARARKKVIKSHIERNSVPGAQETDSYISAAREASISVPVAATLRT